MRMGLNFMTSIVYVVDAEFAIRDSLALVLESTGRQVKTFDSVEAFIYNFDHTKSACLIIDVRMPFIGGKLKKELAKKNINIPIIFISGDIDITDSTKAFNCRELSFFQKPFDIKILLEHIVVAEVNMNINCKICHPFLLGEDWCEYLQKSVNRGHPKYISGCTPKPLEFA
jgi:FixJ family two-component response regulator